MIYRHSGQLHVKLERGSDINKLKDALYEIRDELDNEPVIADISLVKNTEDIYNVRFRIDAILTNCFSDVINICNNEHGSANGNFFYFEISPLEVCTTLYAVRDGSTFVQIDIDPEHVASMIEKENGGLFEIPF